jgi:hypothetical protein
MTCQIIWETTDLYNSADGGYSNRTDTNFETPTSSMVTP